MKNKINKNLKGNFISFDRYFRCNKITKLATLISWGRRSLGQPGSGWILLPHLAFVPGQRSFSVFASQKKILLLFDVDGTLTKARQVIKPATEHCLFNEIKPLASLGIVSGSDLPKLTEQLGGSHNLEKFEYLFPENGLVAYKNGKLLAPPSNIVDELGEEKIQMLINFSLKYMSELTLPVKRGHFIDFRTGIINLCPVGRSCSQVSIQ